MQRYATRIFGRPSNRVDWDRLQASDQDLSEEYSQELYDAAIFWLGRSNGLLPISRSSSLSEAPAALGHFRSGDCQYFHVYWMATPLQSETKEPIRAFISLPVEDYRCYGFSPFELFRAGYFNFAEDCWRNPIGGRCKAACGSAPPSVVIPSVLSKLSATQGGDTIPIELASVIPSLEKVMQGEDLLLSGDVLDSSRDEFLELLWWCLPDVDKIDRSFGTFAFPDLRSLRGLLEGVAPIVGCYYDPAPQNWKEVAGVTEYLANPSKFSGSEGFRTIERRWGEYLQLLQLDPANQLSAKEPLSQKRIDAQEQFCSAADNLISISIAVDNVRNRIESTNFGLVSETVLGEFVSGVEELQQVAERLISSNSQLKDAICEVEANPLSVMHRLAQIEKRIARLSDFEKGIREASKAGCWVSQSSQFGFISVQWMGLGHSRLSITVRPGAWKVLSENRLEIVVEQIPGCIGTEFRVGTGTCLSAVEWLTIGKCESPDSFCIQAAILLPEGGETESSLGVIAVRESQTHT